MAKLRSLWVGSANWRNKGRKKKHRGGADSASLVDTRSVLEMSLGVAALRSRIGLYCSLYATHG
jgi:hypothetical protein